MINDNRMWLTCILKEISIIDYVTTEIWKETPQFAWFMHAKDLDMKIKDLLVSSVTRRWRTLDLVQVL